MLEDVEGVICWTIERKLAIDDTIQHHPQGPVINLERVAFAIDHFRRKVMRRSYNSPCFSIFFCEMFGILEVIDTKVPKFIHKDILNSDISMHDFHFHMHVLNADN